MRSGPCIIGFDGSPASERALREGAALLAPRKALVVVVWEAGLAFRFLEVPAPDPDLGLAPIDTHTARELDQAVHEGAQQLARQGADLARELGFDAEALPVADELTVAGTLVRIARERDARVLVVGAHGHTVIGELLLGSTSRAVVRHAPCPVLVVRDPNGAGPGD